MSPTRPTTTRPKRSPRRKRAKPDKFRAWRRRLDRYRPGLVRYVLEGLEGRFGRPEWGRRLDPTSELILTILTQNSADVNAEKAYEALSRAYPSEGQPEGHDLGKGWGGVGLAPTVTPNWERVEFAPLDELIDVI
ncbi:MAG TPA: hypothetical protein VGK63_01570, partial [Candidatus Limnocylindrales bacterium]